MKIVRLTAENVKRLRAVEITPDGAVVTIGGRNAQGKTSVLDSIAYLLGGKELCPAMPIRKGEKAARAAADLGDITVERMWTEKGSYLTVKSKEGFKAGSPQQVLDKLVGRLTFDPLAFTRFKPDEQAEALRNLVGLDFSELDADREKFYEERTEINRELKATKARLDATPQVEAPADEVNVAALMAELQRAEEVNRQVAETVAAAGDAERRHQEAVDRAAELERQYNEARAKVSALARKRDELTEARKQAERSLIDAAPIRARIAEADGVNRKVRQNSARKYLTDEHAGLSSKVAKLTECIEKLDANRQQQLAKAKFPVPGLSFGENGVTFNGVPFEQASASEQMRVSVGMGFALNPKLKVLLIRDGSLLDEENLAALAKLAVENDGQIWLERVSDGADCSVIIEDGKVKGAEKGEDVF